MTCREKLKLEHPEYVGHEYDGGCKGCPSSYGYMSDPDRCLNNVCQDKCYDCWDREIPGTENTHPIQTEEPKEKVPNVEYWTNEKGIVIGDLPPATPELKDKLDAICCGIKDSGARTEFESGAVRDIKRGVGRCDLLPLDVVASYLGVKFGASFFLTKIDNFQETGEVEHLFEALDNFAAHVWDHEETMLLEVSKHFEDGAIKYEPNNWKRGIPVHSYIDSAVRHFLKHIRGDKDEPHDRAVCWNLMCAIWTCKHKPELNEYRKVDSNAVSQS